MTSPVKGEGFPEFSKSCAIDTAICVQTEPVYALIGARLFLGHAFQLRRVLAVGAILAGIALVLGARQEQGKPKAVKL